MNPSALKLSSAMPHDSTDKMIPRGKNSSVHGLFETQAEHSADRIAVVADDGQLGFGELNLRSNRLAHYLQSRGVTAGVCVGICLDRSVEMLVSLLGILKAGGAYVPLDPSFPRDRLKYMIDDSAAPIILTVSKLLDELPENNSEIICLDRDRAAIGGCANHNPETGISDADLAYVIYTSGSTGKPKGVEVTHGGVVNYLTSINRIIGITDRDVFMAVTTLSFDICAFDLFSPLSVGGKVLLVDRETASAGLLLRERLESSEATILQATPATWRMLIDAGWQGATPDRPLKAISGGEALPRQLADALLARGVELWNLYGPTETTIYSTYHRVLPGENKVSIGRALDNTTLDILDAKGQPVPDGEVGELYIGGVGVARGYRNRPELTAERFLPDPFSDSPDARIYRTGDIARFGPDGLLEYLGRADHQVKIRGFRIELAEIESNLLRQPGVRSTVVVAQERENGAQRLVAFLTTDPGTPVAIAQLRAVLQDALPDYMIPAVFVTLPALPLTLNGKIDRKSLPLPAWGQATSSEHVEPADDVQRALAAIFAKVLDAPRVGVNDNFFELGGDSLSAVSLSIHVRQKFNRTITLAGLFQSPTVAQLARVLDETPKSSAPDLMPLRLSGDLAPLFCLPGSGGSSLGFRNLVQHLPEDRPIYGYNIPASEERRSHLTSIRDYAIDILEQIRQVCPSGPFHLLGYSFGGSVAFEIARILAERGEEVGFLGVIDPWGKGYPSKLPLMPRLRLHLNNVFRGTNGLQYFRYRLNNIVARFTRRFRRGYRKARFSLHLSATAEQTMQYILDDAERALGTHVPGVLHRRVDFYRVDFPPTDWPGCSFGDPFNGWRELVAGELNITRLPCNHDEVFNEPGIQSLAAAVIADLKRA